MMKKIEKEKKVIHIIKNARTVYNNAYKLKWYYHKSMLIFVLTFPI